MAERAKRNYVVLASGVGKDGYAVLELATDWLKDTEAAKKWIRDNGQDGGVYWTACLTSGPYAVRVEQVEKRIVKEVAAAENE